MFYLMSLGLGWLDLHVLVIESHSATAHAHTIPNIGTFWFHFSLGLSVSLREQKDHDSIFHQGGCWGFHLCALLHQEWRFCCCKCMCACECMHACDVRYVVWSGVRGEAVAPLQGKTLKRIVLMWPLFPATAKEYWVRRWQNTNYMKRPKNLQPARLCLW